MDSPLIRVKIIARGLPSDSWKHQTPNSTGRWGNCQFLFDLTERNYDWLVVIDDVSRKIGAPAERLVCPPENTILVTTEPSSITRYGKGFASKFQYVLTSQEPWALPHPNRIYSHTGNIWFNGRTYTELSNHAPTKTETISTVCSSKRQAHTMHALRYDFTQWLKKQIPELEIYGHGVRPIARKHEALTPYRFHLAIENHIAPHHWTEKLSDPFLDYCVPIYCGCPNAADYFPADSFIEIDIHDFEASLKTIKAAIEDPKTYERKLEAVREARNLVMHEYNLLSMLEQIITGAPKRTRPESPSKKLYGRKQMRLRHPSDLISLIGWRTRCALKSYKKTAS